jgi:hypothetical protein
MAKCKHIPCTYTGSDLENHEAICVHNNQNTLYTNNPPTEGDILQYKSWKSEQLMATLEDLNRDTVANAVAIHLIKVWINILPYEMEDSPPNAVWGFQFNARPLPPNAATNDTEIKDVWKTIQQLRHSFVPFAFQFAFLQFVLKMGDHGGMLADDMGLGKTYSMLLSSVHVTTTTPGTIAVIVNPNQALNEQMVVELNKGFRFVPEKIEYITDPSKRAKGVTRIGKIGEVDVHYVGSRIQYTEWLSTQRGETKSHIVLIVKSIIRDPEIDVRLYTNKDIMFIDEADQGFKMEGNTATNSRIAIQKHAITRVWVVTGTPVNNNLQGLLSLFKLAGVPNSEEGDGINLGERLYHLSNAYGIRREADYPVVAGILAFMNKGISKPLEIDVPLVMPIDEHRMMMAVEDHGTYQNTHIVAAAGRPLDDMWTCEVSSATFRPIQQVQSFTQNNVSVMRRAAKLVFMAGTNAKIDMGVLKTIRRERWVDDASSIRIDDDWTVLFDTGGKVEQWSGNPEFPSTYPCPTHPDEKLWPLLALQMAHCLHSGLAFGFSADDWKYINATLLKGPPPTYHRFCYTVRYAHARVESEGEDGKTKHRQPKLLTFDKFEKDLNAKDPNSELTIEKIEQPEDSFSEKEKAVVRICQEAVRKNEQAVIIAANRFPMARFQYALLRHGISTVFTSYTTELSKNKQAIIESFRSKKFSVLIMQISSSGRGINLQFCRNLILPQMWHNPAEIEQARRRIVRVGSPFDYVRIFKVYYTNTIEDFIWNYAMRKKLEKAVEVHRKTIDQPDDLTRVMDNEWPKTKKAFQARRQRAANLSGRWTPTEHMSDESTFGPFFTDKSTLGVTGVMDGEAVATKASATHQNVTDMLRSFVAALGITDPIHLKRALDIVGWFRLEDFRGFEN